MKKVRKLDILDKIISNCTMITICCMTPEERKRNGTEGAVIPDSNVSTNVCLKLNYAKR